MPTRERSESEDQGDDQDDAPEEDQGTDDQDDDAGGSSPAESSPGSTGSNRPGRSGRSGVTVSDGSGVVLGLLVWGWFVVPYLKGGKNGVKAVLMAKFFNKSLDGSPLP